MSISPADITSESEMTNRLLKRWLVFAAQREEQVFLALTLVIGALVGLAVVAFIVLTEHMGLRLYPVGSDPWRRVLIPIAGSLAMGYLLARYFPDARGSGVPQTKAALFARKGSIWLRTVIGKFVCTAAALPAEFRWDVKAPQCRWARESLLSWDGGWDCVRKRKSASARGSPLPFPLHSIRPWLPCCFLWKK